MRCPSCGLDNVPGAKFCGRCGTVLQAESTTCAKCGTNNAPGMRFCGNCGGPLGVSQHDIPTALPANRTPPRPAPSAARSSSSGRSPLPFIIGGVVLALCMLLACVGGALALPLSGGSSVLSGLSGPTATPTRPAGTNNGTPGGTTPSPTPAGNSQPPVTPPTPTAVPAPTVPDEPMKAEYLKGEGPTVQGVKLILTDFKADIGSIFSQRASLNTTLQVTNLTGAPLQLTLPPNSFTVQVASDTFDAKTITPANLTVGPNETQTIQVNFEVVGGLQKFMSVRDIFVVANVGPIQGAKWKLSFQG